MSAFTTQHSGEDRLMPLVDNISLSFRWPIHENKLSYLNSCLYMVPLWEINPKGEVVSITTVK